MPSKLPIQETEEQPLSPADDAMLFLLADHLQQIRDLARNPDRLEAIYVADYLTAPPPTPELDSQEASELAVRYHQARDLVGSEFRKLPVGMWKNILEVVAKQSPDAADSLREDLLSAAL